MTTPDPITIAHGWTDEVRQAVTALEDKYGIELISGPHHAKWVDAACYEIGGGAIRMYKDDVEKLKAERDGPKVLTHEWLQSQDAEESTKPFDEMYRVLVAKDKEITRLTSQLEQCKADERKAMEVIERQKEEVYQANKKARDLEITAMLLKISLEQAEKVIIKYFVSKKAFDGLVGRGPVQDDEIETIRLNWVSAQNDASQWIKDRQAKGEG